MKEVLDYRLEVAAMRGLRVKALKVTEDEMRQLQRRCPALLRGRQVGLGVQWRYAGVPLYRRKALTGPST